MNENKSDTAAAWVDPDEAPELTAAFFVQADEFQGARRVRRGRPKADVVRERITIRLEPDVLAQFRATGPGWQTRMNAALADWLKTHTPGEAEGQG
ncbi:BrnA antitoxin family protein [Pseudomonas sp. HR96]|uniref:BrnA antitoxin family protein n=1 Tax=Pseudomonas sp. HR96 TaxID=1027966 RepID=UPI002A7599B9|nr:BrnA antitoxin family protein [Pseudomonas sp. HR96]WPO97960.1 BrnA antitoxin family protein [Pseudomonas sp. HR96]